MVREINLNDTTRISTYELRMKAPNPMVAYFKTLDVTDLIIISNRKHLKYNIWRFMLKSHFLADILMWYGMYTTGGRYEYLYYSLRCGPGVGSFQTE